MNLSRDPRLVIFYGVRNIIFCSFTIDHCIDVDNSLYQLRINENFVIMLLSQSLKYYLSEYDYLINKGTTISHFSPCLSFRLFTGPTVSEVIKQYWSVIGTPVKPPYWGLGHFYGSEQLSSHKALLELMQTNHTKLGQLPVEG